MINIVESVLIDFNNDIVDSLKRFGTDAISIQYEKKQYNKGNTRSKRTRFVGIPEKINNDLIEKILNQKASSNSFTTGFRK